MSSEQYDGWPNRETWAAHLWITSDEGLYRAHRGSSADDLRMDFECYRDQVATGEGLYPEMILDIGSLWRVDWDEIAKALSEDA